MRSSGLRRRVNSMAPPKPTTVAANDTAETSSKLASNWKPTNECTTMHGSVMLKSKRENTFLVSDLIKPVCEHTAPTTMMSAYALAESKISNMKVGPFRKKRSYPSTRILPQAFLENVFTGSFSYVRIFP